VRRRTARLPITPPLQIMRMHLPKSAATTCDPESAPAASPRTSNLWSRERLRRPYRSHQVDQRITARSPRPVHLKGVDNIITLSALPQDQRGSTMRPSSWAFRQRRELLSRVTVPITYTLQGLSALHRGGLCGIPSAILFTACHVINWKISMRATMMRTARCRNHP
jgi:hypothetical protein